VQPANADTYQGNADAYRAELDALDQEIRSNLATIPQARRKLVTNHDTFRYFADAYDFEVIGTILSGASTGTEQTASDLVALLETLEREGVNAVFVENVAGEGAAAVLAEEAGVEIYTVYTDALGPAGSGADHYTGMMRANVETMLSALAP
jgi:ABC-type Zn uptake system ZnuABC Zn-binding protein ZnuA